MTISSGYRSGQLNVRVGGTYASQHTLGEAADIRLPLTSYTAWDDNRRHTDMDTARKWFGNGVHNRLDGSILVGQYNCLGSLIHPRDVFDPLYERIRKSISRGNQVTLTVIDG